MNFPSDFDTKQFPDARYLALARTFAIWSVILFFVIMLLGGTFWWVAMSKRTDPVLISISENGANWTAILGLDGNNNITVPSQIVQESVIANFAKIWFEFSQDFASNDANWRKCELNKCASPDYENANNICCISAENLFSNFSDKIVADYRARANAGGIQSLDMNTFQVSPVGKLANSGGLWRMTAKIAGAGRVEAFVRVSQNQTLYPRTLGFYISEFNAFPADTTSDQRLATND